MEHDDKKLSLYSTKYNHTTLFIVKKKKSSFVTYLGEIGGARLVQGKGSASRILDFSIRRIFEFMPMKEVVLSTLGK